MMTNYRRERKTKRLSFFTVSIACLLFIITYTSQSFAEDLTLSLSSTQGSPGQTVTVNLGLSYYPYPGDPLASGFQLDISYDSDVLENPSATEGQVLLDAEKEIASSQPSSGVFRIVVSGINQTIILANEEAAYISFDIKPGAQAGQTDLTLSDLAATEPDGQPLDPLGSDGSVTVVVGTPTLSEWGMIIFMTIIMGIGVMVLRKRRMAGERP